jgi:hypothetical protein
MILRGIGFIEIEYKGVTQNLTVFRILAKNGLKNMLYQYFQKKYTKLDSVKKCGRGYFKKSKKMAKMPFS